MVESKIWSDANRSDSFFGAIAASSALLNRRDRTKAVGIVFIYIFLGLIEILAVLSLGLLGSLAVSGVAGASRGDRVNFVLELLLIDGDSLQYQAMVLGLIATLTLTFRSLFSLYLSRKILLFLGRRSALISRSLISNFMGQDILKVNRKSIQENIYALTSGVEVITIHILGGSALLVADLVLIVALTGTMFIVDTAVAFMSLVLFSIIGWLLFRFTHARVRMLGLKSTRLNIESSDRISDVVLGYREIFVKGRKSYYAAEIGKKRMEIGETDASLSMTSLVSKYVMEIGMILGALAIGAFQFITEPATRAVAVISIFLVSSSRIVPAALRLQNGLLSVKTHVAMAKPTLDLIDQVYESQRGANLKTEQIPSFNELNRVDFSPKVNFADVNFSYLSKEEFCIRDLNLVIGEGQHIGIVGPSGSGKSTIVDLLLGIIEPLSGSIQLSGINPREAIIKWPGAVAYVPQNITIMSGSIKENICLGFDSNEIPDEVVLELIHELKLGDILDSSLGINTFVGHRGSNLSGGQKQRIGLARALVTSPKLLVLDEATSSLDDITERVVTEFLNSKARDITMVAIAHRISTVREADNLVYVESGKIMAQGTYKELRNNFSFFNNQMVF